ncbi:fructose-1-phosphate kinase [Lasius niger]|uniref:Fructose-1-phosphate kinase n=1 Tax=Lasius niger TaxID=67767 RepID=A0A0J7KNK4_LASNI|nr:fructose-1-phosphate kinase [Lasius niger]
MAQVLTWRVRMQPGLSIRLTVVQLNLKPEAPLSGLLPTNNEIERDSWEDVSTIELRGVLSTTEIENIHFSGWKHTN